VEVTDVMDPRKLNNAKISGEL